MLRQLSRTVAVLLAALAAALVVSAGPAGAGELQEYPPPDCTVTVDVSDPDQGDTVTISGENFEPGTEVPVLVGGAEVGSVTVADDGTWSFEYTIPADAETGAYEVSAGGCAAGADVLGTTITVGAAAAAPQPDALPRTGSSSTEPLVRTGAVLVAAGAVLVYAVRRRQQAAAG